MQCSCIMRSIDRKSQARPRRGPEKRILSQHPRLMSKLGRSFAKRLPQYVSYRRLIIYLARDRVFTSKINHDEYNVFNARANLRIDVMQYQFDARKRTFDGKLIYARLRINNYREIMKSGRAVKMTRELKNGSERHFPTVVRGNSSSRATL